MDQMVGRIWDDLGSRLTGPLSFRLILQPAMALFFGIRDGMKDARAKRSPYSWSQPLILPVGHPRCARPGGPSAESSCSRW